MTCADIVLFQTAYREMEGSSGVDPVAGFDLHPRAYVGGRVEATG